MPPSPPSPTDDHRPPTPTVVAEVQCGERCREAIWHLRSRCWVVIFESVWPVLLLLYGQLSLLAVSWRLTLICHHWEVDKLGKRKTGQGGSVKPLSIQSWPQGNTPYVKGESRRFQCRSRQSLTRPLRSPSKGWMLPHHFPSAVAH